METVLTRFYPRTVIESLRSRWGDPRTVLDGLELPRCWDCDRCPCQESCSYQSIAVIHQKIKDRFAQNPLDQRALGALLKH